MVLITGANGFLGKHIVKELKVKPITLGRDSHSDIIVDLSKEIPVLPEVDLVIHSAGKAHSVPKNDIEKQSFFDVNVKGTENLLIGLEKAGMPKEFVFISSVSVYGVTLGNHIKEEQSLTAKDPYGTSKILAEKLVQDWCVKNNIICTILRLPLVIGKNPPGNLGAMIDGIIRGFYFNIAGGNAKKSMVLAEDVACFIPNVARIGGTYNLTDGYHPSFFELSTVISKQKGKSNPLSLPIFLVKILGFVGDLIGEKAPINSLKIKKITSDLTFDDTKARKFVGWNPHNVLNWFEK
jgi:nucleoside-diphosphate-sugar epimerase